MADDAHNPFDEIGPAEIGSAPAAPAAPAAAPEAAAAVAPAAAPVVPQAAAPTAEANPFDAIGPAEVAPYKAPTTATSAFVHAAERAIVPAAAGLAAAGPGASAGAGVGAFGGPLAPFTVPAGAVVGGLVGMIGASMAVDKAQDYAISKLPDSWQEAGGQDEATRQREEAQHPTASFLGGLVPYIGTMQPGGFARAALPANATAIQRLMANPATARLFGGGVQGGMEIGQEKLQGQPLDWQKAAIATAFGTVFNKPNRLGERLHNLGTGVFRPAVTPEAAPAVDAVASEPASAPEPDTTPTVAQAADLKVMGPGITEDVFRGLQEQHPDAAMSAQETARQEAAIMGDPHPGPDLHDVVRRMEPETFARYDELSAQRDAFRATIAEGVNPSPDTIAEAAAKRDAIQAQLDKIPTSGAGSDKAEIRRLRAQVREAQRGVDAIQARRDAYAAGTAVDTPEVAQARAHLQAVDYEMRDLSPSVAAAYRRAADYAASETVEPVPHPAEPQAAAPSVDAVAQAPADRGEAETTPATGAPQAPPEAEPQAAQPAAPAPAAPGPGAPVPGLDIAADIARQLIAAGRPTDEARAAGKLLAARYATRAARFKGALGTAEDVYRDASPEIMGSDGRRIPGPPPRPADPMKAPAAPRLDAPEPGPEPSPAPAPAPASAEVAPPRAPRAPRKNVSLLEFLAQAGGIKPTGETRALFGRKSKFLPGIGALVRKSGMGLDEALRAAEEAGYLHDPGAEAGAGPRTLTPSDLLDAIEREHGGTKIYRPGDEPPARRATGAEQRDAVERHVADELRGVGIDAADLDKPMLDAVVERMHKGGETDALQAYEREVMERHDQDERDREHRVADAGEIPGWDVPHDAVAASAEGGLLPRAGEGAPGGASRDGEGREGSRSGGNGDRAARSPADLWSDFAANRLESDTAKRVTHGFNTGRDRNGNQMRDKARQTWQVGNLVNSGFVKDLLITKANEDGSFTLVSKPSADGKSQRYNFKRQEGMSKDGSVMFTDAVRDLLPNDKTTEPHSASDAREAHDRWLDSLADEAHSLFQGTASGVRGSITFRPGKRNVLKLMADANASTFVHESGHQFLEEMLSDAAHPAAPDEIRADAQAVRRWIGNDGGDLKRREHEKFATGFEQYMREGRAPTPGLASVFGQFRNWLIDLYRNVRGLGAPINDDIRGVFDRLLSTEPDRTVIAPERSAGPTIGDIHAADAAEVEPHEAAGAADRTDAEAARALDDTHPEHLNEIEAARNRLAATREAEQRQQDATGGAGTQPVGQAGEVAGGRDGLGSDSVRPDAVPGRGGGGAPADAERQGGGRDAAEGDRLRGGERDGSAPAGRDGSGRDAGGLPFAPSPTAWIESEQPRFVDKAGNIRVDNLTTREDVAQAIHESAAANGDFLGQRRGVVTDGQVLDLADALGMTAESLNRRQIGQAFNAEQIMAARKLLIESATNVANVMKRAASGTDEDVIAYAQAKDRHQMIQGQVAGLTAEWGRAGRAFRDLKLTGEAQQADMFLRQATGKTLRQLKEEATLGAKFNTYNQVSKFLVDAKKPSFGRMLNEFFVNNLISGPVTHVTYGIGNITLTSAKMMMEQPTAAAFGAIRRAISGAEDGVRLQEMIGQFRGAKAGVAPAVQSMLDSYRTGATSFLPGESGQPKLPFQWNEHATPAELDEHATVFSIIKGLRDGIMAAGAMGRDAGSDLFTGARNGPAVGLRYDPNGAIPDVQVRGVTVLPLGTVARFPGRNVAAIHSFFRAMNYSIDKAGQAYRMAANEGLKGQEFHARIGDIITNPDEAVMERARSVSTDLTLMGQGGEFMNRLSKMLSTDIDLPLLGVTQPFRFIDPFVKIAGNVMGQSLMQRSPIGLMSRELRADLMGKNGATAQDLAAGRMLVGTALSVTFGTLAAQGVLTGSGPQGKDAEETRNKQAIWKLAGNQAHSFRIGDTWYDLHRLGPIGMLMGVAADMYDVAHLASEGELWEAAAALQEAITQNVIDESFMKGPAELMKAIEEPGRFGEGYIKNFASSFVPYSVALAQMDRASDPYTRRARTVMDGIKAKIPGLSEELYPKIDTWGAPMPNRGAAISPYVTAMYTTKANADPLAKAMYDIGVYPAPVEKKIRGVDLTDAQYTDFAIMAGHTARQRLEAMVRLPDWASFPDHIKAEIAKAQIKSSRESAMGMMQAKYPSIPATAAAAIRAKAMGEPKPKEQITPGS